MQYVDRLQMEQLAGADPELEQRFRELLGSGKGLQRSSEGWQPQADTIQLPDEFVILVELAGISKDDIKLAMDESSLIINGTRTMPFDADPDRMVGMELSFGSFSRSFPLTADLDTTAVDANYRDGFLTIRIPRVAQDDVNMGKEDA